ncbi:hypothetical protein [Rhodobacter sp. NSM]|uniref:hypothetical protein n=1 Tax=Rhodobacter sp. NSM TaxID=3457501 RepID=UPI003FD06834
MIGAWHDIGQNATAIAVWGLLASAAMTTVQDGMRMAGLSRMSLPLLFGAAFSLQRDRAMMLGYVLYILGGWAFALLYALAVELVGQSAFWTSTALGLAHGVFLATVFLPALPHFHPNVASSYDGPDALSRLEPPGAFGLNYGRMTPLSAVLGQTVYGLVFGMGYGF